MKKKQVLIVGSEGCVKCKSLQRELENNFFAEVDVEYILFSNAEGTLLKEVQDTGLRSFPMIRLDGEWIPTSLPQAFISQYLQP